MKYKIGQKVVLSEGGVYFGGTKCVCFKGSKMP